MTSMRHLFLLFVFSGVVFCLEKVSDDEAKKSQQCLERFCELITAGDAKKQVDEIFHPASPAAGSLTQGAAIAPRIYKIKAKLISCEVLGKDGDMIIALATRSYEVLEQVAGNTDEGLKKWKDFLDKEAAGKTTVGICFLKYDGSRLKLWSSVNYRTLDLHISDEERSQDEAVP
jgi:hypothetical protein